VFVGVAVWGSYAEVCFRFFGLVSLVAMFSMRESRMPVRVYFRWYRENVWARNWESLSVGKVPWYIVRLMSSVCMPQLHPSVWRGVLAEMMFRAGDEMIGMSCCLLEYHSCSVEWICCVRGGG
jgi:hypothetical protein